MSTARDREIQQLKKAALMEALGAALELANPQSGVDIPADVRARVSAYLHSWVIGPMAMALLERELGAWRNPTHSTGVAERYLEEAEDSLDS